MNCHHCNGPMPPAKATGRRRQYCSIRCRRAAEVERRSARRADRSAEAVQARYAAEMPCLSTPVQWMAELLGRPLNETERYLVMSTTTLLNARRMLRQADAAQMEAEADLLGEAAR